MDEGPHSMWFGTEEQYVHSHVEGLVYLDSKDPKSIKACFDQMMEEERLALGKRLFGGTPLTLLVLPEEFIDKEVSPVFPRTWTNKIHEMFDPNKMSAALPYLKVKDLSKDFMEGMGRIMGGGE